MTKRIPLVILAVACLVASLAYPAYGELAAIQDVGDHEDRPYTTHDRGRGESGIRPAGDADTHEGDHENRPHVEPNGGQHARPTVGIAQTPALLYDEAMTVYLGNLARRQNGVPPLRWNVQLTEAARWFSWDSVENRPIGFCGHQDSQGNWPDGRARIFGFLGWAGAENAFCGYVTPQQAIGGWMNSPGHRANLLDRNSREVGLGYYRRASDGRGYVTQDFGHDPVYAPVVIANEAISTTSPNVALYIYGSEAGQGFGSLGQGLQMKLSNDACFAEARWEPYAAERAWTLAAGEGWRPVYVKLRDAFSRTLTVSDTIYLGANVPLSEIGAAQMSSTQPQVILYNLDGRGLPLVQFSLGWLADDTFDTFHLWTGNGERVGDDAAWGGTAFRLRPGSGDSFVWFYTTDFVKDTPLVAYVRLKVNSNTSASEVVRISVIGGGTEYGPLMVKGTDFAAANRYQEFPLAFTFNSNPNDVFLIFHFWRTGPADVYVDAVSFFTAPQRVSPTMTWDVPGGNYRGQGVWVRYTDGGGQFSDITEGSQTPLSLSVAPSSLSFLASRNGSAPPASVLKVSNGCQCPTWQVSSQVGWLQAQAVGADTIQVRASQRGLDCGSYTGTITVSPVGVSSVPPVSVPVTLTVVDSMQSIYLPLLLR